METDDTAKYKEPPVLVLGAVPPNLNARLADVVDEQFSIVPAKSWHWAMHEIVRSPVEMLIVDPSLEGDPRPHVLERIRVLYPSLPIVLYTKVTPAIGPALLRLGRAGISHLIVAWTEDQPSAFRNTLLDAASKAVSRQLIRDLQVCFQDWPAGLKLALEHAILNPTSVMTVSELAKRAGTDRRSCLRWFNKAQLPPPSTVLTVLRVLYAARLLEDPGYTLKQVAKKIGTSPNYLAMNTKMIFGVSPTELRRAMTRHEILAIARERFLLPPGERVRHASLV